MLVTYLLQFMFAVIGVQLFKVNLSSLAALFLFYYFTQTWKGGGRKLFKLVTFYILWFNFKPRPLSDWLRKWLHTGRFWQAIEGNSHTSLSLLHITHHLHCKIAFLTVFLLKYLAKVYKILWKRFFDTITPNTRSHNFFLTSVRFIVGFEFLGPYFVFIFWNSLQQKNLNKLKLLQFWWQLCCNWKLKFLCHASSTGKILAMLRCV